MTITAERLEGLLEQEPPQGADGYTEFLVRARGSLAGGPVREQVLSIRGYTDGIACTSFGQSNVAVVAVAESGRTTVLSESGELVLEPDALTVGCPACIAPSNGRSYRRSPAWDLTLTGHRPEQFFQTHDGLVVIETDHGCVVLSDPLVHRSPCECAGLRSPIPLEIESDACT